MNKYCKYLNTFFFAIAMLSMYDFMTSYDSQEDFSIEISNLELSIEQ